MVTSVSQWCLKRRLEIAVWNRQGETREGIGGLPSLHVNACSVPSKCGLQPLPSVRVGKERLCCIRYLYRDLAIDAMAAES